MLISISVRTFLCKVLLDFIFYAYFLLPSSPIPRHARGRDEWESAVLQNANTKCNGLLPLWGPHVTEPSFASCLARSVHKEYLYIYIDAIHY